MRAPRRKLTDIFWVGFGLNNFRTKITKQIKFLYNVNQEEELETISWVWL